MPSPLFYSVSVTTSYPSSFLLYLIWYGGSLPQWNSKMICRTRRTSNLLLYHQLRRPRLANYVGGRLLHSAKPIAPTASGNSAILAPITSDLDRISPRFDLHSSQITVLQSPSRFYDTLKVCSLSDRWASLVGRTYTVTLPLVEKVLMGLQRVGENIKCQTACIPFDSLHWKGWRRTCRSRQWVFTRLTQLIIPRFPLYDQRCWKIRTWKSRYWLTFCEELEKRLINVVPRFYHP